MHRLSSIVGLLAAMAAVGCEGERKSTATVQVGPPVLVVPDEISFGTREKGEQLEIVVQVENHGGEPLELRGFWKSCACGPVEVEENGVFRSAASAVIPAGGYRRLRMRWAVNGLVGGKDRQRLQFQSNDPKRPVTAVDFVVDKVLGTANALPSGIAFDRVLVGAVVKREVAIRDPAVIPRRPAAVVFDGLGTVTIEQQAPTVEEASERHDLGTLVTRLVVTVDTSRAGRVDGMVRVTMEGEGQRQLEIGVAGDVVSAVTCVPGDLVLPRPSAQGKIYSAKVRLRPFAGAIDEVKLDYVPPGIAVVLPITLTAEPELVVTLDPKAFPAKAKEAQRTVRLQVRVQGAMHEVNLPVLTLP
jgi:hypothetical protein